MPIQAVCGSKKAAVGLSVAPVAGLAAGVPRAAVPGLSAALFARQEKRRSVRRACVHEEEGVSDKIGFVMCSEAMSQKGARLFSDLCGHVEPDTIYGRLDEAMVALMNAAAYRWPNKAVKFTAELAEEKSE